MNESLPPPFLVRTWFDLQNSEHVCSEIKLKRLKLIELYFNTIKLAALYVDTHHCGHKKAS